MIALILVLKSNFLVLVTTTMKLLQMTSHLLKQLSSTLKGVKFLVIKECATYDIVDVTGLVYNLQTEAGHEKDGKLLPI